jgi:hypothetical protein
VIEPSPSPLFPRLQKKVVGGNNKCSIIIAVSFGCAT